MDLYPLATATIQALSLGGADASRICFEELESGASDRRYWRLRLPDSSTCVLSHHQGLRDENNHFAELSRLLGAEGIPVPRVLAEDRAARLLWIEDLGDQRLDRLPGELRREVARSALEALVAWHGIPPDGADGTFTRWQPYLQPPFDAALYQWEQDYFFSHFPPVSGIDGVYWTAVRSNPRWLEVARQLAEAPRCLIHRDFQTRNILVHPATGRACLIDFQGIREGLPEYDLVSLAYDPYLSDPEPDWPSWVVETYRSLGGQDVDAERLRLCAIQRLMQAIGAYAKLSDKENRAEYKPLIEPSWRQLRTLAPDVFPNPVSGVPIFASGRPTVPA